MTVVRAKQDKHSKSSRSAPRRLAEWISLAVSVVLILGIAIYLLAQAIRNGDPFIACQAEIIVNETRAEAGQYIVPLRVTNPSQRSLRKMRVEVEYADPATGQPVSRDIDIEYLGERSHQTVYVCLPVDPRQLQITATPAYYLME